MKSEEWSEIVEWIADRFPESQWHAEQAVAYFFDIEEFDASDVWGGVFKLYEQGLKFAPNGSQLLAAVRDERREAAMRDRYRGLPEDTQQRDEQSTWEEFTQNRFGEQLTPNAVIRRLHAERFPDCTNPLCDVHSNEGSSDATSD